MSKKTCFIVSQIGEPNSSERNHADKVLKYIITPSLKDDFEISRADTMYHSDRIDDKIFEQLKTSDLVIADLTNNNPNVFLEVGYRMALEKPIIYIMQENSLPIPFDIRTTNIIRYDLKSDGPSVLDSVGKTVDIIKSTVDSVNFDAINSIVSIDKPSIENTILKNTSDIKDILIKVLNIVSHDSTQDFNAVSFQERLLTTALENPDKLEKLFDLMNKYPQLISPDVQD